MGYILATVELPYVLVDRFGNMNSRAKPAKIARVRSLSGDALRMPNEQEDSTCVRECPLDGTRRRRGWLSQKSHDASSRSPAASAAGPRATSAVLPGHISEHTGRPSPSISTARIICRRSGRCSLM
jgi:hypothetical protein